jgi:hypothetical protein
MAAEGEGMGADTEADMTTMTTVTARGGGRINVIEATGFETTATAVIAMESAGVLLGALLPLDALVRVPTQRPLHPRTRRNPTLPHRVCSQLRRTRSKMRTGRKPCSSTMNLLRLANPLWDGGFTFSREMSKLVCALLPTPFSPTLIQ